MTPSRYTFPAFGKVCASDTAHTPPRPLRSRAGGCVSLWTPLHLPGSRRIISALAALSVVLLVTGQRGCEWQSTEAAAVLENNRAASGKLSTLHSVTGEQPRP